MWATRRERIRKSQEVLKPIMEDLAKIGFKVDSLDELRHLGRNWKPALPVLLRWLPLVNDDIDTKETIVRCLSVPWIGTEATAELIADFRRYATVRRAPLNPWIGNQLTPIPDEEKITGSIFSLAWTIGNALSIVDVNGHEKEIIELCRNRRHGMARQMVVMSLWRLRDPEAEELAVELLSDEDVKLHAVIALGKMKSKRALFELERALTDKNATVRKEARKAITKITRGL